MNEITDRVDKMCIFSAKGGRQINEDYAGYTTSRGLCCYVVADGLGGHGKGDVAAKLAVHGVLQAFERNPDISPDVLKNYFEEAQRQVLHGQKTLAHCRHMRTTLLTVIANEYSFIYGYAGDSRLYHFRRGHIQFITQDHSVPGALAKSGQINFEEIRFHEDRQRLLKAIGISDSFKFYIQEQPIPIHSGDLLLLCTDGFWEHVLEKEMEEDLAAVDTVYQWVSRMEERLKKRVIGTYDNYTALAIKLG